MKTIKIEIADNLSPKEEALAISKQLVQKSLTTGGQNKDVKRIGTQVDVIDLKTIIEIERISTEKPVTMLTCNVCGCEYQSDMAKHYFHNYGGNRTKRSVCSDKCRDFMVDMFGVRIAKSASKLPAPINYFRKY